MLFCFGSYVDVLLSKAVEKKVSRTAKCAEQNIRTGTQNAMTSPQKTKHLVNHRNDVNEIEIVERGKKT